VSSQNPQIAALLEAEASVLGGVFLGGAPRDPLEVMASLSDLDPEDFYSAKHRFVFEAMRRLETASTPIDPVTVETELARAERLEAVGGVAFLGDLACRVPTAENTLWYARTVRDAALVRRLKGELSELVSLGDKPDVTGEDLLSESLHRISALDVRGADGAIDVGTIALDRWRQIEQLADAKARGEIGLSGFPTGVKALDAKIGGYQPGIVQLIAARPAMGKSSLALAGAAAASFAGYGVHVFSQEESKEAYGDKLLARQSGVPAEDIRNAELHGRVAEVVNAVANYRHRRGWLVDFASGMTAEQIIRRVRRHKRANGTKVVFVDYVQIVRKRDPRQTDNDAWAEIITQFADAAKQDAIAYVVLCQLNRDLEKRNDKRPTLADLRGSGGLEERSRIVIAVYRGSVYGGVPQRDVDYVCKCAPPSRGDCEFCKPSTEAWRAEAQLLVLKNSNGRTGRVFASWSGPTMRME
jgi:replicative DNA helicase